MKILVVCQYYYPEQFYVTDVCEALVRSGHEVTVLTGLPNYPSGIITEEYRHGKRREEWRRGVHIVRCFEIGRKKGAIGLALNYLSFLLSSAYRARRMNIDADILFCYQLSPALMAYPAVLLKRRHRCPLLLYCLDLWPESMKTLLHSENSPLFRVVKHFCTMLYQACDHIAVPSEAFVEYMQTVHGIVGKRLSVLPQFAPDALLNEKLECDNGVTDFVFLGNIGTAQDMPCLLEAVSKLLDLSNWKLHIVGGGSMLAETERRAEEFGLSEHVVFYGRRPAADMPAFYRLADACLLTLTGDTLVGQTVPAKLQGYMAAGKPIFAAVNGPAHELIEKSGCGLAVDSGDSAGLAEAMRTMILQPEIFGTCGANARTYFLEHFTERRHMDALIAQMKTLVEETSCLRKERC